MHASSPRMQDGRLVDAHQPLQEEDMRLLEFALARCQPQALTLEYIREKDALRDQLCALRGLIAAA